MKFTAETFRDVVTESYIGTGKAMTVKMIAECAGVSESTVRKTINDAHGLPNGTTSTEVEIEARDRSYGGVRNHRAVPAYLPSRQHMRALVIALRQRSGNLKGE